MTEPKYPQKDRQIRIFRIHSKRWANESEQSIIKEYMHPKDTFLRAYIRQLSAGEMATEALKKQSDDFEAVINYRPEITTDCYIEFQGDTYRVTGVDGFDLKNIELKLRIRKETPPESEFAEVRYRDWRQS